MIWLNSDFVGTIVGILVFLVMIVVGWVSNVPLLTSVERALIGLLIGYVVGFFLSSRIRRSMTRMMVEDKIRKEQERAARTEEESAEGGTE